MHYLWWIIVFLFFTQADTLKERYQKIGDTKKDTPVEVLCENFPGLYEFNTPVWKSSSSLPSDFVCLWMY